MKVEVYGASDDLIEIEGDITDEFNPFYDTESSYLAFSDGTVLEIDYTGSFWRIHVLETGNGTTIEKREATDVNDDYSDHVTLSGDNLRWVLCGWELAHAKE